MLKTLEIFTSEGNIDIFDLEGEKSNNYFFWCEIAVC